MSIENNLKRIADALEALVKQETLITEAIAEVPATAPIPPVVAPAPQAAPAPVVQAAPIPPVAPTAPAPVAAPVATNVPFTTSEQLMQYVMEKYKTLGPEKGAQIQQVLVGLGYGNINDIQPENYQNFFNGVEGIQ